MQLVVTPAALVQLPSHARCKLWHTAQNQPPAPPSSHPPLIQHERAGLPLPLLHHQLKSAPDPPLQPSFIKLHPKSHNLTLTSLYPSESDATTIAALASASPAARIISNILQHKLADHTALAAAALEAAAGLLPAQLAAAQQLRQRAHKVRAPSPQPVMEPTPRQRVLLHSSTSECLSVSSTAHRVGCLWDSRSSGGIASACNIAAVQLPHVNQMPNGRQWYGAVVLNSHTRIKSVTT